MLRRRRPREATPGVESSWKRAARAGGPGNKLNHEQLVRGARGFAARSNPLAPKGPRHIPSCAAVDDLGPRDKRGAVGNKLGFFFLVCVSFFGRGWEEGEGQEESDGEDEEIDWDG